MNENTERETRENPEVTYDTDQGSHCITIRETHTICGLCTLVVFTDPCGWPRVRIVNGIFREKANARIPVPLVNGQSWADEDRAVVKKYLPDTVQALIELPAQTVQKTRELLLRHGLMPGALSDAFSIFCMNPENEETALAVLSMFSVCLERANKNKEEDQHDGHSEPGTEQTAVEERTAPDENVKRIPEEPER